jgi:hypothetical protein
MKVIHNCLQRDIRTKLCISYTVGTLLGLVLEKNNVRDVKETMDLVTVPPEPIIDKLWRTRKVIVS